MKTDITLSKSMTIGMKPYESIKPSVTITFKDVESDDIPEKVMKFDLVASQMFDLETARMMSDYTNVIEDKEKWYEDFITHISTFEEELKESLKNI